MNVPAKFEVRSFTRSWDNKGIQKIWAVHGYAHALFSPKFLMSFCDLFRWTLWMHQPNLNSVALPVPEIRANIDWSFGWGCRLRTPNLGKEEAVDGVGDRGWYRSKEPSIVTFYRAMHNSIAIACRPSVCPSVRLSVTLVDPDHIGWKSRKLTACTISPTPSLFVAQGPSTYCQGKIGKFWGD